MLVVQTAYLGDQVFMERLANGRAGGVVEPGQVDAPHLGAKGATELADLHEPLVVRHFTDERRLRAPRYDDRPPDIKALPEAETAALLLSHLDCGLYSPA